MARGRQYGTAKVYALLTLAALSACTTPSRLPDERALRIALSYPELQSCDELTCYYGGRRDYAIRALQCRQAADGGIAICSYERALLDRPLEALANPEDVIANWVPARTKLQRLGRAWTVMTDSDD